MFVQTEGEFFLQEFYRFVKIGVDNEKKKYY